jgi:hypothetical protein
MFNSPTEWCPIVRQWVALDEEGVAECARLHHCGVKDCPLARLFAQEQSKDPGPTRAAEVNAQEPSKSEAGAAAMSPSPACRRD